MSITKSVGRLTLWSFIIYLFVKGALIVVPRNMVAAISALVAALVHACCGTDGVASMQEQSIVAIVMAPAPIHNQRLLVAVGECKAHPVHHEGPMNVPTQGQSLE